MPNYLVVLVSKVLEGAEELASREEGMKKEPIDRFYTVGTYCKINYLKKYAEISGLYRVKIKSIDKIEQEEEEGDSDKPKIIEPEYPE